MLNKNDNSFQGIGFRTGPLFFYKRKTKWACKCRLFFIKKKALQKNFFLFELSFICPARGPTSRSSCICVIPPQIRNVKRLYYYIQFEHKNTFTKK